MRKTRVLTAFVLLLATSASAGQVPTFAEFPVAEHFQGPAASPDLSSRQAREFRTVIRSEALAGPNFAGHFTIARWGCGFACISWEIINEKTGKVWLAPFTVSESSCTDAPELCQPSFKFKLGSELVIVTGARNESGAGKYFYRWHGGKLMLLHVVAHKP